MTTPGRAILAALEAFSVGAPPPKGGGAIFTSVREYGEAGAIEAGAYRLAAHDRPSESALRATHRAVG